MRKAENNVNSCLFPVILMLIASVSGCGQTTESMKRYSSDTIVTTDIVMMINLKNDSATIRRYENYHAAAWPEVTDASKKAGFRKISIYRLGNRLVMVLTVPESWNAEEGSRKYLSFSPRVKEWVDTMAAMQEVSPEAPAGTDGWTPMKRIYFFEAQASPVSPQ